MTAQISEHSFSILFSFHTKLLYFVCEQDRKFAGHKIYNFRRSIKENQEKLIPTSSLVFSTVKDWCTYSYNISSLSIFLLSLTRHIKCISFLVIVSWKKNPYHVTKCESALLYFSKKCYTEFREKNLKENIMLINLFQIQCLITEKKSILPLSDSDKTLSKSTLPK